MISLILTIASVLAQETAPVAASPAIALAVMQVDTFVDFYEHQNFGGRSVRVPQTISISSLPNNSFTTCANVPGNFNDVATSARWGPNNINVKICFYEHSNCGGKGWCYNFSDKQELDFGRYAFSDAISSFSTRT